jgi:DNA-binding FadR family transcriptional regulator
MLAISILSDLPTPPDYITNALGHVDEAASEALRRPVIVERETMRARARALSAAVVMAFEAMSNGSTLPRYSLSARVAIEASCAELALLTGDDAGALYLDAIMTRDRAIEIEAWAREPKTEAAE